MDPLASADIEDIELDEPVDAPMLDEMVGPVVGLVVVGASAFCTHSAMSVPASEYEHILLQNCISTLGSMKLWLKSLPQSSWKPVFVHCDTVFIPLGESLYWDNV